MTREDLPAFADKLRAASAVLGRRFSDDVIGAYFRALSDLDAAPLLRVLDRLVRTAESGTRFPTPGELRQRAGGTVTAADAPLSDAALDRVRQAVLTALAPYRDTETEHGSARPVFEAAWKAARRREGWGGTVTQRERLWQDWLQAGEPVTRDAMSRLRLVRPREPGEDLD
jgi:hypothetical protein